MFHWIIQNAVVASLLAVIVVLICRANWFSAAGRHALWLVVLIKLITPPIVVLPWAIPMDLDHLTSPPITTIAATPDRTYCVVSVNGFGLDPYIHAFLWIVMMGGFIIGTIQVKRVMDMYRRIKRGRTPSIELLGQIGLIAGRLGVRPPLTLCVDDIASPLTFSMGSPRLLLPCTAIDQLDQRGLQAVLAHELAHLRRGDHLFGWLELAAMCIWWWCPLFWIVRQELRKNAELACDAWAVSLFPDRRRVFAEAIIDICQRASRLPIPAFAASLVGSRRAEMEARIISIVRDAAGGKLQTSALLLACILAVISLPGWFVNRDAIDDMPARVEVVQVLSRETDGHPAHSPSQVCDPIPKSFLGRV